MDDLEIETSFLVVAFVAKTCFASVFDLFFLWKPNLGIVASWASSNREDFAADKGVF